MAIASLNFAKLIDYGHSKLPNLCPHLDSHPLSQVRMDLTATSPTRNLPQHSNCYPGVTFSQHCPASLTYCSHWTHSSWLKESFHSRAQKVQNAYIQIVQRPLGPQCPVCSGHDPYLAGKTGVPQFHYLSTATVKTDPDEETLVKIQMAHLGPAFFDGG